MLAVTFAVLIREVCGERVSDKHNDGDPQSPITSDSQFRSKAARDLIVDCRAVVTIDLDTTRFSSTIPIESEDSIRVAQSDARNSLDSVCQERTFNLVLDERELDGLSM